MTITQTEILTTVAEAAVIERLDGRAAEMGLSRDDAVRAALSWWVRWTDDPQAFRQVSEEETRGKRLLGLLTMLQENEYDPPQYFTAGDFGRALGCSSSVAAQYVQSLMDIRPVGRRGYPSWRLYDWIDEVLAG